MRNPGRILAQKASLTRKNVNTDPGELPNFRHIFGQKRVRNQKTKVPVSNLSSEGPMTSMKAGRLGCVLAATLFGFSGAAQATETAFVIGEQVTLRVGNSAEVTGSLLAVEDRVATVSTQIGDINVPLDTAVCEGPGCPQDTPSAGAATTAPIAKAHVSDSLADQMEDAAATDENLALKTDGEGEPVGVVMLSDVLFGFGEDKLTSEGITVPETIAAKLPLVEALEVVGHTDSVGSDGYNKKLGMARARAVITWLEGRGHVEKGVLPFASAGETQPIAPNRFAGGVDNPDGRARNRRVEFRILNQDT